MNRETILTSVVTSMVMVVMAFAIFGGNDGIPGVSGVNGTDGVGAIPGGFVYNEVSFLGGMGHTEKTVNVAATSVFSTTTLQLKDSGVTYSVSASGTTFMLPAVTETGAKYRFEVGGALDTGNVIIDSVEGDNIEGTLLVAGAVVDCDAEDQINFVVDGENIGDYVELTTNGTNWLIGDSGALTSAKLTCTDPS